MKPFLRKKRTKVGLDMEPLIDVVFMLLLFFMLTSSFVRPSISLKMPTATNQDKPEREDIIVSVDIDGSIYVNREKISIEALESVIKKEIGDAEDTRVIFQGDESIMYKKFVEVLDSIKRAGAQDINIAHERKEH